MTATILDPNYHPPHNDIILPRHIDTAFDSFDLDQKGVLYFPDAVLALDGLMTACWGPSSTSSTTTNNNEQGDNKSTSVASPLSPNTSTSSPTIIAATSNTNANANTSSANNNNDEESLSLPGVSRSKIVQAIKHALLKHNADPDAAVSATPVVSKEIFDDAAQALLVPLPDVHDVDTFAAFQSLNIHQDKTRVNRRALRRALFSEYDAVVYAKKDEEDLLDDRIRARAVTGCNWDGPTGSPTDNTPTFESSSEKRSPSLENTSSVPGSYFFTTKSSESGINRVGGHAVKFDGIRNMIGCDDLLLQRFAAYPDQGFSFDEWRQIMIVVKEPKRRVPLRPVVVVAPENNDNNAVASSGDENNANANNNNNDSAQENQPATTSENTNNNNDNANVTNTAAPTTSTKQSSPTTTTTTTTTTAPTTQQQTASAAATKTTTSTVQPAKPATTSTTATTSSPTKTTTATAATKTTAKK